MKTINFKKGNKNIRFGKVLLRSGAVIASVILLSFTVSAQGLWKQFLTYNSFGKTAILMVNASDTNTKTEKIETESNSPAPSETATFRVEPAVEEALEVEPWMTNDMYFGAYNHFLKIEQDKPLEVEPWMTNDDYFSSRFTNKKDRELEIEAWMIDDRYWRY
jgi:hypothetical protein